MSGNKIVWAGCCSWSHYIRNSVSQIASSKQKYFVSKLFREVTEPGWYSLRIDLSIARWRKWLLVIDFLFWSIFKLIYSEMSRTTTQEPRPASRAKQQCQHTPNSKIASNSFKRKIRSLPIRTGLSRSTLKSLTEETLMIFSWSFRTKFVMTITCTLSWGICALTASLTGVITRESLATSRSQLWRERRQSCWQLLHRKILTLSGIWRTRSKQNKSLYIVICMDQYSAAVSIFLFIKGA